MPVTGKAAKLMGTGKLDRKASTRGKQKASGKNLESVSERPKNLADLATVTAPDPYAIDSDDNIKVNPVEDPIINAKPPKKGSKSKPKDIAPEPVPLTRDLPDRTKSKRDAIFEPSSSKRRSKAVNDFDDNSITVDAVPSDEPEVVDGPDDMQLVTKPKGLQRSATSAKKPESKKSGGLFSALRKNRRASDTNERPRSRAVVEDEQVTPKKRTVTGGDDSAKRPRRDDRRRSEKPSSRAAEGYVYDTAGDAAATEAEDADARREERRAKRAEKDRALKKSTGRSSQI